MKQILIIPFLILFALQVLAQSHNVRFGSVNAVGLISGSKTDAFVAQTINGIKKDKWFAGAGVGLDFYNQRTVPLFIDIRRDLINKKNTPFAYADAGVNFAWLNFVQREHDLFPKTSPGLYYDLGLGCKLAGKNNRGFLISAGYSFKQVKESVNSYLWSPNGQTQLQEHDKYNYLYRRFVIKIGFML